MDRRSHERLWVQVQCVLHINGKASPGVTAVTKNVSRGGVLISWPKSVRKRPQIGDIIRTEIPMLASLGFDRRYLECVGEVVRISCDEDNEVLVALRFRRMRIKPQKVVLAAEAVM